MFQRSLVVAILCLSGNAVAAAPAVPQKVTDAVKKKYPDARIVTVKKEKERHKEKVVYWVSLQRGNQEMDVDVNADGEIVSEEVPVEPTALPEAVQKSLKNSMYGDWKIKSVERVILGENESTSHFEILVENEKQGRELVFAADGRLEKQEKPKKPHRGAAKAEVEQLEAKEHAAR